MPCRFVANSVSPVIMPNNIAKKMAKIMPRFYDRRPSGRNKYIEAPKSTAMEPNRM